LLKYFSFVLLTVRSLSLRILLYSFVMFVSVPRYVGVPVFHAIASARRRESSAPILATIWIRAEAQPITLTSADGSLRRALVVEWKTTTLDPLGRLEKENSDPGTLDNLFFCSKKAKRHYV